MSFCVICRDKDKSKEIKHELLDKINDTYDEINPDLVIAVGGDGTIIKAVHQYPNAVIFGVHTGHLGFYAKYNVDDLDVLINDINNKEYNVEEVELLSINAKDDSNVILNKAINEISIVSPLRAMVLDVYIDAELLEHYKGTGLCISTPAGSTAFNKSLNGSIIESELKTIQLTEIAGINSNAYRTLSSPLVLNSNRVITLKSNNPINIFITVDYLSYEIKNFKEMVIKYNGEIAKMAYHNKESFIERLKRTFLID